MRSKNKKRKSGKTRSEKLARFFKRGTVFLMLVVMITMAALAARRLMQIFYIREIAVSGNYHLGKDDIVNSISIKKGESMLDVHFNDIEESLRLNTWIKKVALRKQFPGTLVIKVEEAIPKALLSVKKRLYLIDEDGEVLERIEGKGTPFLPVIKGISPKNKKNMTEALKLVDTIYKKNVFADSDSIEIGHESYGLRMNVDGELIKVGYGNYSDKFERWKELEPEIRRRGVPLKYVDLRFKDSIIVKPTKISKKGKTS